MPCIYCAMCCRLNLVLKGNCLEQVNCVASNTTWCNPGTAASAWSFTSTGGSSWVQGWTSEAWAGESSSRRAAVGLGYAGHENTCRPKEHFGGTLPLLFYITVSCQ